MDPKGCSPEVYRECRDIIEQVIKAIELETLKSQVLPAPKEYWDSVSETKQFTTPFQAEIFSQYVNNDAQVLDVGCGYGRTLNELYHMGFRKLTADFALKEFQQVEFITMNGHVSKGFFYIGAKEA